MLLPFIPGSGGGGGGGGGVRGGDNMRIRDHMDGILEARGYFRKHVAAEKDSLYRTVSDVLFGTQKLKDMLRNARDMFVEDREETGIGCSGRKHSELYILSEMLGVTIQLLEATDQNISTVIISPGDGERDEAVIEETRSELPACRNDAWPKNEADRNLNNIGSSSRHRHVFLCHSGVKQYDPIFLQSAIDNAGFVQSVLYKLLYHDVFNVPDAYDAAEVMLADDHRAFFELGWSRFGSGKPDRYDREFQGTAMEALREFCIPFPYKVAKTLDPKSYRNIEYDVWSCEKRAKRSELTSGGGAGGGGSNRSSRRSSPVRSNPPITSTIAQMRTIGSLESGTPCVIRDTYYGEALAFVVGPTQDRRLMQVYLPEFGTYLFVSRKMILPIKPDDMVAEMYGAAMRLVYSKPPSQVFPPPPQPMCLCAGCTLSRSPMSPSPTQQMPPGPPQPPSPVPVPEQPYQVPGAEQLYLDPELTRQKNLYLTLFARKSDPEWMEKLDFSVPPPPVNGQLQPPAPPPPQYGNNFYSQMYTANNTSPLPGGMMYETGPLPPPQPQPMDYSNYPSSPMTPQSTGDQTVSFTMSQNGNYAMNQQVFYEQPGVQGYCPPTPTSPMWPTGYLNGFPSPSPPLYMDPAAAAGLDSFYPFPWQGPMTPFAVTPPPLLFSNGSTAFPFPMSPSPPFYGNVLAAADMDNTAAFQFPMESAPLQMAADQCYAAPEGVADSYVSQDVAADDNQDGDTAADGTFRFPPAPA